MGALDLFFRHFEHPRGPLGRVALGMMARSNAGLCRMAVDLLAPAPTEAVLEIGFGHGVAVAILADRIKTGRVCGVEPSLTAIEVARARNREAVRIGRVDLRQGSITEIPFDGRPFDAVMTLNTVYFWRHDPGPALAAVRRVLRGGGRLCVGFRTRTARVGPLDLKPGLTPADIDQLAASVAKAGFDDVRVVVSAAAPEACLLACKPG